MANYLNRPSIFEIATAIINEWSEDELLEQVINAANNGKLKILE